MSNRRPARGLLLGLWVVATFDLLGGVVLLVWPGAWQELWHPNAMGTVFYPLQQDGARWLARGALTVCVALRPGPLGVSAVASLWLVEAPGEVLLAWRLPEVGPWSALLHGGRAIFALGVASVFGRSVRCMLKPGESTASGTAPAAPSPESSQTGDA